MPSRATVQEFSDSYPFCHNGFRPIMMPKIVSVQHSTRRHLTSFVGRKAELNDVRRLLSDKRLVTLTGPDGMGKSVSRCRSAPRLHTNSLMAVGIATWLRSLTETACPSRC